MQDNKRILVIRTGGTVDSVAYKDPRNPPKFVTTLKNGESLLKRTVKALPNSASIDWYGGADEDSYVKDSQEYTLDDIRRLASLIRRDSHRYILLTHGTDAMVRNACWLQQELAGTDKTIIFTGAMVPLSMHEQCGSDAIGVLSHTLKNIHNQPAGVYIAGYDEALKDFGFFDPARVEKDKATSKLSLRFTLGPSRDDDYAYLGI